MNDKEYGVCDDGIACEQNERTPLSHFGQCCSCKEQRDYEDDICPKEE